MKKLGKRALYDIVVRFSGYEDIPMCKNCNYSHYGSMLEYLSFPVFRGDDKSLVMFIFSKEYRYLELAESDLITRKMLKYEKLSCIPDDVFN